ncbi:MAG: AAA family ATPase [Niastella sp.]|nr:AAA family ATPase [Niastella sp.]
MVFWHIQMNQPWGRNGGEINSKEMLERNPPVIGTGEWDDLQCRYFKGADQRGLKINDIVLVHEGKKPIALCKVVGENFTDASLSAEFHHGNFRQVEVLMFLDGEDDFPQPQGTLERLVNSETGSYEYIEYYYDLHIKNVSMNNYSEILLNKKQIILQGPPGTGKTYTAKDIAEYLIYGKVSDDKKVQKANLEKTDQFKLVQFHPSYSYEDFVRGISAKSNGNNIEYLSENKAFAEFAALANKNWKAAFNPIELSQENWLQDTIDDFKEYLLNNIEKGESRISITPKVYINRITENSIRYNSDAWEVDGGVPVSDLIKMYNAGIKTRKEVKELTTLTKTAKSLATYWIKILELFQKYIKDNNLKPIENTVTEAEKKFVLIIDEINRANLPSVLGELIYALEYRGEEVSSMYAIDEDYKLIIPDNLLIIGTMNTADRSVGHIDYAIRRRFAFINILPNETVITNPKAKVLYGKIAELFTDEYRAPDFSSKDVQLGHSYFIVKDDKELKLKLEYEIIPILQEYLKDGILLDKAKDKINELYNFGI